MDGKIEYDETILNVKNSTHKSWSYENSKYSK